MRSLLVALCLLVTGCSWAPSLGVYKIDVNQGNFVTQDAVEKLKVGQSRSQVRLILGTPLIADAFHGNRWDYVYRFENQGRVIEERKFMVAFKDDKLESWSGDSVPVSPIRGYSGERREGVTTTVSSEDRSWWRTLRDIFGL